MFAAFFRGVSCIAMPASLWFLIASREPVQALFDLFGVVVWTSNFVTFWTTPTENFGS